MNYDEDWSEDNIAQRRAMVRKTIRPATLEELAELGEMRFTIANDPWCEKYFTFLKEHAREKFYRAETHDGAEIVYCADADKGIWFLPGTGMGVIQPKGLKVLAGIVADL
jgi:hypothetical protein